MIGVKMNTFNDNSGEPEQDANSALTELDKGLRSGKVGEQCEAIVRFPRLFEKYPFPILINSSFLKLADIFRMGNNFLRLWVLRVCQQSEKHLDKILNVDEFLRRVYSVLHSNDPVARALALKTLGAVAGIIPERQNVHHAIRRGLDSHDNVEVDAAIYATTRFAAHSNAFAVSMCNKLSDMVECESTAADRRVKLVRALRTVHGGAVRAHGVLNLLRSLLEKYPSSSLVRAAITALTHIATDTVVHVPDQVELLLHIASNDGRSTVRRAALAGLAALAKHAALWPASCIDELVRVADHHSHSGHGMLCLQVMQILVECPAICAGAGCGARGASSALRHYCAEAALSPDLRLSATAAHVLTSILVHWHLTTSSPEAILAQATLWPKVEHACTGMELAHKRGCRNTPLGARRQINKMIKVADFTSYEECLPVEGSDLMLALESIVIATGADDSDNNLRPLRMALQCLVKLCNAEPTVYTNRTARTITLQLDNVSWRTGTARGTALLEALAALDGAAQCPPHAVAHAMQREDCIENPADDGTALVLLCTVFLQERALKGLNCKKNPAWQHTVLGIIEKADGWVQYRVARAALRYGHHELAGSILSTLWPQAASEAAQRWLTALCRAAAADCLLMQQGITGLEAASSGWEVAGGWAGGAAGWCAAGCAGCGACTPLAHAWMRARATALAALARAAVAARALCTQPPPAIAHAHAQAARDPGAKAGAVAGALRRAARALHAAGERYGQIARTAFHADHSTLKHFYISQHTYNQLSQFLERITSPLQEKMEPLPEIKPRNLEERIALAPSQALTEITAKLFDNPTTNPGITHRHAEAVLAAVRACAVGTVWPKGACLGRGCSAACRLSVWAGEHPPPLQVDHRLAVKLEGVVLPPTLSKRQKPREVKAVQITVTATPHPRTNEKTVELTNVPPVMTAVQSVTPVRDFFSAQQLVSVPAAGLYTVAVDAAFVDEHDELWHTGPRTAVVIKAHEEPTAKGNSQTTRGRF